MPLPTSAHFIYIPSLMAVGVAIGFVLGARVARDELAEKARRDEARAERRAARLGQKDPPNPDEAERGS